MATQRQDGAFADAKESASDLRGKEYCFCTETNTGKVDLCGAGGVIAGVISEGRDVGYHTSYNTGVQLKVIAGGSISPGDQVQSDGSGHAISGASNSIGRARTGGNQGEYITFTTDRT